jgi:hypothetical protein
MTPLEKATRGPSLDPLGGDPTVGLARPCSRDRPYEGSVSPACLRTVAANRRLAKLYLSPIRAVPARGLVDARVGASTVQSVLRCHKLCEIWHAGVYFDRLSRNCKQRRTRWRREEDLNRRDLHFGAATERRADRTETRALDTRCRCRRLVAILKIRRITTSTVSTLNERGCIRLKEWFSAAWRRER